MVVTTRCALAGRRGDRDEPGCVTSLSCNVSGIRKIRPCSIRVFAQTFTLRPISRNGPRCDRPSRSRSPAVDTCRRRFGVETSFQRRAERCRRVGAAARTESPVRRAIRPPPREVGGCSGRGSRRRTNCFSRRVPPASVNRLKLRLLAGVCVAASSKTGVGRASGAPCAGSPGRTQIAQITLVEPLNALQQSPAVDPQLGLTP